MNLKCFCNTSLKSKIRISRNVRISSKKPWATSSGLTKYQKEITGPHTHTDYRLHGLSPRTKGTWIECYLKLQTSQKD